MYMSVILIEMLCYEHSVNVLAVLQFGGVSVKTGVC